MTTRARNTALVAIAVCALAVRAAHDAAVFRSPAGSALVEDARAYHGEALRLLGLVSTDRPGTSFLNLGYPYALAAVYGIAGPRIDRMLGIQAMLGAISCVLLALTARTLVESDWAAIVTGSLYALYRPAVFYDGLLLTPSLTSFTVISSMCAAVAGARSQRFRYTLLLAAGAATGCGVILRPNVVFLVPILAAAVAWISPDSLRGRGACAFILGTLVVVVPIVMAQRATQGAWVPLSANGGMNFWTGNQRDARGAYAPASFVDQQNAGGEELGFLEEARRRTGRATMTLAESSGFWFRQGMLEIRSDPTRWLRLLGRKILLLGSRLEIRTNVSLAFYEGLSSVLRWTPVSFPLLFSAGLAGLTALVLARRYGEALVVASTLLVATATCALFFVAGEYRHIAASGLALGAGAIVACPLSGARRALPFVVGFLGLGWSLAYAPRDLAQASDPAIDFSNFARAICVDEGRNAREADATRRAEALLDRAPGGLAKRVYVDDARLWVRTLASRDGSSDGLERALDAAESLLRVLPQTVDAAYSPAFGSRVRTTLIDRLELLAASPACALNPELGERARILLARARRS